MPEQLKQGSHRQSEKGKAGWAGAGQSEQGGAGWAEAGPHWGDNIQRKRLQPKLTWHVTPRKVLGDAWPVHQIIAGGEGKGEKVHVSASEGWSPTNERLAEGGSMRVHIQHISHLAPN